MTPGTVSGFVAQLAHNGAGGAAATGGGPSHRLFNPAPPEAGLVCNRPPGRFGSTSRAIPCAPGLADPGVAHRRGRPPPGGVSENGTRFVSHPVVFMRPVILRENERRRPGRRKNEFCGTNLKLSFEINEMGFGEGAIVSLFRPRRRNRLRCAKKHSPSISE